MQVNKIRKCIECGKPISGSSYGFAGGLACESCIRAYYRNSSEAEIARELRERGNHALSLIANWNAQCDICGGTHKTERCPDF